MTINGEEPEEVNIVGDKIKDIWQRYRKENYGCCFPLCAFFDFFTLLPFIVEGSLVIFVLGLISPIGFIFGLIEHHLTFVWFLLVVIMNVGGIGDIFADIMLLVRMVILYTTGEGNHEFENEVEGSLFGARIGITIFGTMGFIFCYNFYRRLPDKDGKKKSGFYNTSPIIILAACIFAKVFFLFVRFRILFNLLVGIIRQKSFKISHELKLKNQLLEALLVLDVLWTALPLGILTALEAFYFKTEELHFSGEHMWEIVKLFSLMIDLVGVTYLVYYEVLECGKRHKKTSKEREPLLPTAVPSTKHTSHSINDKQNISAAKVKPTATQVRPSSNTKTVTFTATAPNSENR